MLRVEREVLPQELQDILDANQAAVDTSQDSKSSWKVFKKVERSRAKAGQPTVFTELQKMFHHKCAYCETLDANEIEHHWPKSPHPHNARRGTSARMFRWDNLLLSCHECNSWSCKGTQMKWDGNKPRLLNPCVDEPLCYLKINLEYRSPNGGQIEPSSDLSDLARKRALYTINRLKLNVRDNPHEGRVQTIRDFLTWVEMLSVFGADFEMPSGYTIRQRLLEMLAPTAAYLAPVRQILHAVPEIEKELLEIIPELEEVINKWALRKRNCQH